MIRQIIPNFSAEMDGLGALCPPGFVLAFNVTLKGAEHLHSTYPQAWQRHYQNSGLLLVDPIMWWIRSNTGHIRWSDVKFPDVANTLGKANKYGINFGASFSMRLNDKLSFLSASRENREFTNEEIQILQFTFSRLAQIVFDKPELSEPEKDMLRDLANGFGHKEIANRHNIAVSTVKARIVSARNKLGSRSSTQAVATALSLNQI